MSISELTDSSNIYSPALEKEIESLSEEEFGRVFEIFQTIKDTQPIPNKIHTAIHEFRREIECSKNLVRLLNLGKSIERMNQSEPLDQTEPGQKLPPEHDSKTSERPVSTCEKQDPKQFREICDEIKTILSQLDARKALELASTTPYAGPILITIAKTLDPAHYEKALELTAQLEKVEKLFVLQAFIPKLETPSHFCKAIEMADENNIESILERAIDHIDASQILKTIVQNQTVANLLISKYGKTHGQLLFEAFKEIEENSWGYFPLEQSDTEEALYKIFEEQLKCPFVQSEYISSRMGPERLGCCLGITLHWANRIFLGKDSFIASKRKDPETKPSQGLSWTPRIAKKFRKFTDLQFSRGSGYSFGQSTHIGATDDALLRTLLDKKATNNTNVVLIYLEGRKNAHLIGAKITDQSIVLMDPNYGEFEFLLPEMESQLSDFCKVILAGYSESIDLQDIAICDFNHVDLVNGADCAQ